MTEAYVPTRASILVPKGLAPTPEPSPQAPDPLRQIAHEIDDLSFMITNCLPSEINRDNLPTTPVESLIQAVCGITRNQTDRLKELRKEINDPRIRAGMDALLSQIQRDRNKRLIALLDEVTCEVDQDLIQELFPAENDKKPEGGAGFATPQPQTRLPQSGDLLPVAKE